MERLSRRGSIGFSGSYAWANFTVLALGVWAVAQRDSVDAISMVSRAWGWASASAVLSPAPVVSVSSLSPFFPRFQSSEVS